MCESLGLKYDDVVGEKLKYEEVRTFYISEYGMDVDMLEELLTINYKEDSSIAVKMVICKLVRDYLTPFNEIDDMLFAFYKKLKSMHNGGLSSKKINELVSISSFTNINGNLYPKGLGQVINDLK